MYTRVIGPGGIYVETICQKKRTKEALEAGEKKTVTYVVHAYDNFHAFDPDEHWIAGEFSNYEEAVDYCKAHLQAQLSAKNGDSLRSMIDSQRGMGTTLRVEGRPPDGVTPFSPDFYLREVAIELLDAIQKNNPKERE